MVYWVSPNIILMLLVVIFVGKYYPVNVILSPPIKFKYLLGDKLDTKHGSCIEVRDAEFGIFPKTENKLGMKDPHVAF